MPQYQPEGPLNAKIVLVGESLGRAEAATGKPFQGASGTFLRKIWSRGDIGIDRKNLRIENVYEAYPPGGNIDRVSRDILRESIEKLKHRLSQLTNIHVIVPVGNLALFALTGKGIVPDMHGGAGISTLRGSTLPYVTAAGNVHKVIPTVHPGVIRGNTQWERRTIKDWQRIVAQTDVAAYDPFEPRIEIAPHPSRLPTLLAEAMSASAISVDVETWGKKLCVFGYSIDGQSAVVLPRTTKLEQAMYDDFIKTIIQLPCEKIMHNGLFDMWWIARTFGTLPVNYCVDSMDLHHAIDPVDDHDLAYVSSLTVPGYSYWKDMAKDAEKLFSEPTKRQALYRYNGFDCAYTWEAAFQLKKQLHQTDRLDFYWKHYASMYSPLLAKMLHGINVDQDMMKQWHSNLRNECEEIRSTLKEMAGTDLYAKTDFGKSKLLFFFHNILPTTTRRAMDEMRDLQQIAADPETPEKEKVRIQKKIMTRVGKVQKYAGRKTLNLPPIYPRKKRGKERSKTPTLDEVALKTLARKHPEAVQPVRRILEHREKAKIATFLVPEKVHGDGRLRSSYSLNTEAGRLKSSSAPDALGYNAQNIDRRVRPVFIPDRDCLFCEIDLSQAEDRIVKVLCGTERTVELANRKPWNYDAHTDNAAKIFGIPIEEITKTQRNLGKKGMHAVERDMHGRTLSENLLKEGYIYTVEECEHLIERTHGAFPELKEIYFRWVQQEVINEGRLVNSWGRVWDVTYQRKDENLYRRAYSFYPQSECVDLLNMCGLVPFYTFVVRNSIPIKLNAQVHDSILFSFSTKTPEDVAMAYGAIMYLVQSLETPREYTTAQNTQETLVIPASVSVGRNWGSNYEWKRTPSWGEFNTVVNDILHETS